MSDVVWLASYPKSGNTWFRILIGCLSAKEDAAIDINGLPASRGIASSRAAFDDRMLIDSGLLTHEEIDCLRPRLYEELARDDGAEDDAAPDAGTGDTFAQVRFVKVHDAYTLTPLGEPLLAGARGAKGAIVLVRDPRDVAPSLANHKSTTIDAAIDFMNDMEAGFSTARDRQPVQLRQKLPRWSGHVATWLGQRDIPIHLLRYEDLKRDTAGALSHALRFAGVTVSAAQAERAAALAAFENLQAKERETGFAEWRYPSGEGQLFFRRGEAGAWREELTRAQIARIEAAHGAMMQRLGYELSADTKDGTGGP